MRNISTRFFPFSVSVVLGLALLATTPAPAGAHLSECTEGCMNQLSGDICDCKSWWLEGVNIDENAYNDCVGAAASHALVCFEGCDPPGGGEIIGLPGGNWGTYGQGQQLFVSAGLKVNGSYTHDGATVLAAQAYIISQNEYMSDTTIAFDAHNWVSIGPMTFDGDSLWKAQLNTDAFPAGPGYLVRYDMTIGPGDSTIAWVSSLVPQGGITAVGGGPNPGSLRLTFTPNPTRNNTHINFFLPSAGPADVVLYDLAGRRLRSWTWGSMTAGPHEVVWDGTRESGQRVASSVVFCRLTVHGQTVSHTLTRLQ